MRLYDQIKFWKCNYYRIITFSYKLLNKYCGLHLQLIAVYLVIITNMIDN